MSRGPSAATLSHHESLRSCNQLIGKCRFTSIVYTLFPMSIPWNEPIYNLILLCVPARLLFPVWPGLGAFQFSIWLRSTSLVFSLVAALSRRSYKQNYISAKLGPIRYQTPREVPHIQCEFVMIRKTKPLWSTIGKPCWAAWTRFPLNREIATGMIS